MVHTSLYKIRFKLASAVLRVPPHPRRPPLEHLLEPRFRFLTDIIPRCWHQEPEQRLSFDGIVERLHARKFRSAHCPYPSTRECPRPS